MTIEEFLYEILSRNPVTLHECSNLTVRRFSSYLMNNIDTSSNTKLTAVFTEGTRKQFTLSSPLHETGSVVQQTALSSSSSSSSPLAWKTMRREQTTRSWILNTNSRVIISRKGGVTDRSFRTSVRQRSTFSVQRPVQFKTTTPLHTNNYIRLWCSEKRDGQFFQIERERRPWLTFRTERYCTPASGRGSSVPSRGTYTARYRRRHFKR